MQSKKEVSNLFLRISVLLMVGSGCSSPPAPRQIDPMVDKALRAMSRTLAGTKQLCFRAQVDSDEMLESGRIVQISNDRRVGIRRPNKLFAVSGGDNPTRRAWYDGRTFALLDAERKLYATIDAPDNIDDMIDFMVEELDLTLPLADLVFSNPYDTLTAEVAVGEYVGLHKVGGHDCHHLAFQQELIDWQIWIDAGESALPRKVVITYKDAPGHPQFSAILEEWNLSPGFSDADFAFRPPADARRVDMLDLVEPAQGERR